MKKVYIVLIKIKTKQERSEWNDRMFEWDT